MTSMAMIIAYVRPPVARRVLDRLHELPGVTGATFDSVRGFGRGHPPGSRDTEEIFGSADRERIEVAVAAPYIDAVVKAIQEVAETGARGDGKIFVLPIERAIRISTGDEGEEVLRPTPGGLS